MSLDNMDKSLKPSISWKVQEGTNKLATIWTVIQDSETEQEDVKSIHLSND